MGESEETPAEPAYPAVSRGWQVAPAPAQLAPGAQANGDVRAYEPATVVQKIAIRDMAGRQGYPLNSLGHITSDRYGKATLDDLTKPEATELLLALQKGDLSRPAMAA